MSIDLSFYLFVVSYHIKHNLLSNSMVTYAYGYIQCILYIKVCMYVCMYIYIYIYTSEFYNKTGVYTYTIYYVAESYVAGSKGGLSRLPSRSEEAVVVVFGDSQVNQVRNSYLEAQGT